MLCWSLWRSNPFRDLYSLSIIKETSFKDKRNPTISFVSFFHNIKEAFYLFFTKDSSEAGLFYLLCLWIGFVNAITPLGYHILAKYMQSRINKWNNEYVIIFKNFQMHFRWICPFLTHFTSPVLTSTQPASTLGCRF